MTCRDNNSKMRIEAELRLKKRTTGNPAQADRADLPRLMHELQVHQIELEMQNEELRAAHIALELSRDRYVDFYDFTPVGYITLNHVGIIMEINLTGASLLGAERGMLINRNFAAFVCQDDADRWHRYYIDVLQHDIKRTCELGILRDDGSHLAVQLDSLRLVREGNEPVARLVLADISERRKHEEALKKSEERLRSIVDQATDGIFVADSQGNYVDVNSTGCKMLGYSREEVLNLTLADILDPTEISRLGPAMASYANGEIVVSEWRFLRKDGSTFLGEVRGKQLSNGNLQGILIDITERRRAEQLLQESEREYRLLFENILDGFAYCKGTYHLGELQDFVFLHVNSQFGKLTGFTDVIGKKLSEVVPGILTDNPEFLDVSRRVAATGNPEGFETHVARLDGWATITIYCPVKEHFVAVFRDITDQKRAEQELLFMNSQLAHEVAKQTADLSDLTAHIQTIAEKERAHLARELHDELGSTLVGMSMEVGHLKGRVTDPQILKGLAVLKDLISHAVEIKRAVVDELYPSVLDHEGFTGALTWMVNVFQKRADIEVELLMPSEINMEDPYLLAAYRITQECLTNIAKHAGASKVTLEATANGGFLELTVHDNGIGLPLDIRTGGHGILGMIERARYLGGSMNFESEKGKGTTARLRMPLIASRPEHKKRVLVVDDHAIVRDALRRLISETDDFSVEGEASDGKSAVQMGVEGEWDVILLDISLPKMNGIEVLERIRAARTDIPIIMLTSYSADEYGNDAIRKGAVCYLEKGATDKLVEEMRRATMREQAD